MKSRCLVSFCMWALSIEETVFSPVPVLRSFVEDWLAVDVWANFQVLYSVLLVRFNFKS
jgi:hypothetical protein